MIMRVPDLPKGDSIYAKMLRAFRKAGATDFCTGCHAWVTREHGVFCGHYSPPYNPTQRLGTLALVTAPEPALPAPIDPQDGHGPWPSYG